MPLIGLQYFDEIESGGVADAAGLKRGDFLLAVNDVDVRHMSHEKVVQLIRQSGDKVTMMIATPVPKQLVSILKKKSSNEAGQTNAKALPSPSHRHQASPSKLSQSTLTNGDQLGSNRSQMQMSQSVYASFTQNPSRTVKAPPPAPPKRDPSTTLSTNSRQRARSLVVASEVRSAHNQSIDLINSSTNQSKAMMIDGSSNNENNEDSRMVGGDLVDEDSETCELIFSCFYLEKRSQRAKEFQTRFLYDVSSSITSSSQFNNGIHCQIY